MAKIVISESAANPLQALLKKQANLQTEVTKRQAALDTTTAELKEVTKQIRIINGAATRAATVAKTGGKEILTVNGKTFAISDAVAAVREGRASRKSLYYLSKDGSKKLILSWVGGRPGARNHNSGYGYTSAKTLADFGKIIKAQKVGFLHKFEK